MTTERTETKEERATAPTSAKEQVKEPTSQQEKSTSTPAPVEETYTKAQLEDMITKAVTRGKGEVQSALDKKIAEAERRAAELEAQMEGSKLQTQEERERESWGDTEEVKQFQTTRRQFHEERGLFQKEKQTLDGLRAELNERAKGTDAKRLASEYGVDEKTLLEAKTPEEMESKAVKFAYEKTKSERDELKKTPQHVDSSVPAGLGENWRELSPEEKLARGLSKRK